MGDFLPDYFEQNILETLLRLELPIKSKIISKRKGTHKSVSKGQNLEFKEHREYAKGDDITKIDWRLYGKTEKLYIKEFEEDASCNVLVIIDKSASMNFSFQNINKLEYAKYLFATIYAVFTRQGDNVGLCVFDDNLKVLLPFSGSASDIPNINNVLNNIKPGGNTDFKDFSKSIKDFYKNQINMVYVISDFISSENEIFKSIEQLSHISKEVFFLHLIDPCEEDFNFKGEYLFYDYESEEELLLNASTIAEYYKDYFLSHLSTLRKRVLSYNGNYYNVNISEPYTENFMKIVSHYKD